MNSPLPSFPFARAPASSVSAARRPNRSYQRSANGLSPGQLRVVVLLIVALHVVVVWGLLQVQAVRTALVGAAPIFVELLTPPASATPPPPVPRPVPKIPPPVAIVAAPPSPAPVPAAVETVVPVVVEPPPAVMPPAPSQPKIIPPSAVQYLVPPALEYPRASRHLRESGQVMVRVYIDEAGLPGEIQVTQSSGYSRLDDAAVVAVRKARFKPYTENGHATAGWAFIPLSFDLEK